LPAIQGVPGQSRNGMREESGGGTDPFNNYMPSQKSAPFMSIVENHPLSNKKLYALHGVRHKPEFDDRQAFFELP